jgi:hypothetical protein
VARHVCFSILDAWQAFPLLQEQMHRAERRRKEKPTSPVCAADVFKFARADNGTVRLAVRTSPSMQLMLSDLGHLLWPDSDLQAARRCPTLLALGSCAYTSAKLLPL